MSKLCLYLSILIILATHFCYYPKWKMSGTEATISWDVSGYYMYLPAMIIHNDLKKCQFRNELQKYNPSPGFQQAFIHEKSGNYVMKYSIGQAIVFSPFFLLGHVWALNDNNYPSDGFSLPYQLLISLGMLLIAMLGLYYLRKSLLTYWNENTVGFTLLGLVIGTNYLNYSAIDGAMTHNSLFSIYAVLIWLSIQFYKNPNVSRSFGIGLCVGLAALIRPTEIISSIIPILWGINIFNTEERNRRIHFIQHNWKYYTLSIIIAACVGTIQLVYWKYVSGEWIVYSYQDQGFSWLSPHVWNGLFSYRSGWLVYSPFMIFALIGFTSLYNQKKSICYTIALFFLLFSYIAFAWDIWWYGGSLGQRAMVQAYPILAFPLCAFIQTLTQRTKYIKVCTITLGFIFVYANIWFTHQAHKGGLLYVGQMTGPYFWKTLFKNESNTENLKLLDGVTEIYEGELINKRLVYKDTTFLTNLSKDNQYSKSINIKSSEFDTTYDRLRVSIDASIGQKEWTYWAMTQFIVTFKQEEKVIDSKMIRLQRHLGDNQTKQIYLDIIKPKQEFSTVEVRFWNSRGQKPITLSNLSVVIYNEE